MNRIQLGKEIERVYQQSFMGAFPYKDCFRLAHMAKSPFEDIIPEFDLYFATIAGYSSSATRLHNRSKSDLQAAREVLSLDAYQRFPVLERCRAFITPENTPQLISLIQTAESLKQNLLMLLICEEE